ncbi:MAG: class I SAM-dependent methyltransferase [Nitrococcus sp.]|nr:class I SAM-dependent methyltransferase [Nitrococcus sp.]
MAQKAITRVYETQEQLKEHYEIEKALAYNIRNATKEERRHLYASTCDELFRRVPYHPLLTQKYSAEERAAAAAGQMKLLRRFLNPGSVFLEVGPGDCALSFEVAKCVKHVYAIDVSDEITKNKTSPANFKLILSDGCSIAVNLGSVNLAYSNQLMEHLHPDDAFEQLQNIYNALAPGGIYFCITPNRLSGPHDISSYFDTVATGFHLKEYTMQELSKLFKKVGFSKVMILVGAKGKYIKLPTFPMVFCEWLLRLCPYKTRKAIACNLPFTLLFGGIKIVGVK